MSVHGFTSTFASQLDKYLAFKKNMGFYGISRIDYLKRFDAYCTKHERSVFDRDTVEGWVRTQLERSGRYRSWMSYIRDFGRWLKTHGSENAYVLSDRWKAEFVRASPYLLTSSEVEAFFAAASQFKAKSPWQWQAVAFFTLMHSCGIRTGEARALLAEQVDLDDGHLDILWSKGNRSRRLPLTAEIIEILADCEHTSRKQFGSSRNTFFVSATGTPVTAAAVGVAFSRIWDQAGLPRAADGRQPRPYDFRHHFAYANIERWMTQGKEVTALLPYLSRYMGHATLDSTYYYIHTSPDFLAAYADLTQDSQSLLPEVGFE
jgi:integrase